MEEMKMKEPIHKVQKEEEPIKQMNIGDESLKHNEKFSSKKY